MITGKNITMSFVENGKKRVLFKNLSFSFPEKGLVKISGPSGTGKSTFLYLLAGLQKPKEGKLYFQNKPYPNDFTNFRRAKFGFVFQNYELLPTLNVKDNLAVLAKLKGVSIEGKEEDLLRKVGLEKHARQSVSSLSGGECQRLAILRALIGNPSILLCDEPTGALDEENAKQIMQLLYEESKRKLVIIVTHQPELLEDYNPIEFSFEHGIQYPHPSKEQSSFSSFSPKFFSYLSLHQLKNHWRRNLFSFFSLVISWTFSLFILSFSLYAPSTFEEKQTQFYDYPTLAISKLEKTNIGSNHLTLTKTIRPNVPELLSLQKIGDFDIYYDLGAFLPSSLVLSFQEEEIPIRFLPDLSKRGGYTINESLNQKLKNQSFSFSIKSYVIYQEETLLFSYQEEVQPKHVVNDCHFLGEDTLYYDYFYFRNLLEKTSYQNTTYYRLIQNCSSSEMIGNFRMLLYAPRNISSLFEYFKNTPNTWEITSQSYQLSHTFSSLFDVITLAGSLFTSLALLGAMSIFLLSLSSLIQDEAPTCSLFSMFGATKKELGLVFALEFGILTFLALSFSLFSFLLGKNILNRILYSSLDMNLFFFSPLFAILLPVVPLLISVLSYFFCRYHFYRSNVLEKRKAL